jgi:hypothetical protein
MHARPPATCNLSGDTRARKGKPRIDWFGLERLWSRLRARSCRIGAPRHLPRIKLAHDPELSAPDCRAAPGPSVWPCTRPQRPRPPHRARMKRLRFLRAWIGLDSKSLRGKALKAGCSCAAPVKPHVLMALCRHRHWMPSGLWTGLMIRLPAHANLTTSPGSASGG